MACLMPMSVSLTIYCRMNKVTVNYVEGSGRGLIYGTAQTFACRNEERPRQPPTEKRTGHFPNAGQKNYRLKPIRRILLKRISGQQGVPVWTALTWLRIRSSNRCSGFTKARNYVTIRTAYYSHLKGRPSIRFYKAQCSLCSTGEKTTGYIKVLSLS
jgi:hypothetical protein